MRAGSSAAAAIFCSNREGITQAVGPRHRVGRCRAACGGEGARRSGDAVSRYFPRGRAHHQAARDAGNIARACEESEPNRTIKAPPSLDHRYIHEEYRLPASSRWRNSDALAGVATPTIDALIRLAGLALGIDYARDGLTLETARLGRQVAGGAVAVRGGLRARGMRSPDGAQRNPGSAHPLTGRPRITLRSSGLRFTSRSC